MHPSLVRGETEPFPAHALGRGGGLDGARRCDLRVPACEDGLPKRVHCYVIDCMRFVLGAENCKFCGDWSSGVVP